MHVTYSDYVLEHNSSVIQLPLQAQRFYTKIDRAAGFSSTNHSRRNFGPNRIFLPIITGQNGYKTSNMFLLVPNSKPQPHSRTPPFYSFHSRFDFFLSALLFFKSFFSLSHPWLDLLDYIAASSFFLAISAIHFVFVLGRGQMTNLRMVECSSLRTWSIMINHFVQEDLMPLLIKIRLVLFLSRLFAVRKSQFYGFEFAVFIE